MPSVVGEVITENKSGGFSNDYFKALVNANSAPSATEEKGKPPQEADQSEQADKPQVDYSDLVRCGLPKAPERNRGRGRGRHRSKVSRPDAPSTWKWGCGDGN